MLLRHEKEKKREYNRRIMNIEHGTFTPLVFSVSGVLVKNVLCFTNLWLKKIAKTFNESYEKVITVIWCKLSFIILRAALLCIRGSWSNHVLKDINKFSLAFYSAGFWLVAWAKFPCKQFELRCNLLFIHFSYIMVKLLT